MGTSISQSSPRTSGWKPVHICYTSDIIPEERILTEVWRSADNPSDPVQMSTEMKSDIIYSCYKSVKSSNNFLEALNKFNGVILETKSNSIAAEFAKRSIPVAYQGADPADQWTNRFFSEITKYIVSRDTSGFVGEKYRNKTVRDLDGFKKRIGENLDIFLSSQRKDIKTKKDWNVFIDTTIAKLKSKQ
ncbi:MAG: hypothetical protein ABSA44_04265 [Bacteroidota bacterium]|jgi:hypothetical protein